MRTGRRALLALALAAASTAGRVQGAAATVHRIGWLAATHVNSLWDVFIEGLRERGWVEGRNIEFDRVYSGGYNDRFPAPVSQLVQRKADIIICAGTPPPLAARDATNRIPTCSGRRVTRWHPVLSTASGDQDEILPELALQLPRFQ